MTNTLTDRLQQVADLVPACRCMADIGTDHGYLPMYLIEKGVTVRAIACDIHAGPLERAKEHLGSFPQRDRISLRLGGGLSPLAQGEADGVTICGMGGLMIRQILEEEAEKAACLHWLVLQPQNHVAELKQFLSEHHFRIEKEVLSLDGGQLYEILKAVPGEMPPLSLLDAEIGATADYRKDPLFPLHVRKLIRKRHFLVQGVAEDTANERNRRKREQAVKELEALEALL